MYLDIEPDGNVDRSFSMVYRDVSPPRQVYCVKYPVDGVEQPVQVTGWDADTHSPCPAFACRVEESGDGTAWLIYGGNGGVRFKLLEDETPWSLTAPGQWGETHLVYPVGSFLVYTDEC